MKVEYKKAKAAVKSYVLYTGNTPASWLIFVDGVERGFIRGANRGQYSSESQFKVFVDGALKQTYSKLSSAKKFVEKHFSA